MQGHGVVCLVVDSFNDIDFALIGPVWANEPAVTCVSTRILVETMQTYYAGHVPLLNVSVLLLNYRRILKGSRVKKTHHKIIG